MASNGNDIPKTEQRPMLARRTVENDPFNHSTGTDPNYSKPEIAKENDHDMNRFVQALNTIHGFPIQHLQQKLLGTMKGESSEQSTEISRLKKHIDLMNDEAKFLKEELWKKEKQLIQLNQGRDWDVEHDQLELRHHDWQRNYDKMKYESEVMLKDKTNLEDEIETLRSKLMKTEREFSQQKCDIFILQKYVEPVEQEARSLKTQLHESNMQILKQKQGSKLNIEHGRVELRHKDIERKYDKIKDEDQVLMVDKTRLENEKLRSIKRKTEQEFAQQSGEMTKLKEHVESVAAKSESLKSQLQEKERDQLIQNQGLNLNVEYKQLEMSHNDLQRKFDKVEDEARALMVEKTRLENENKKLSSVLRKTEQESLEQKNELSKFKKRVENMDIGIIETMKAESSSQRSEIPRFKKPVDLIYEESKFIKEELWRKEKQLIQLNQDWNVEREQLEMKHHDLQRNYDRMKCESQVMLKDKTNLEDEIETLRSKLMKTEREFSQQKCDIFILQKYVESVEQEARSLKTQLHESNMQILKQKQGSNWNMEHGRHRDMQQKYDQMKDESEAKISKQNVEKSKLENEIETLRSTLKRTENEFFDKRKEMSRLTKQVELMDEESKLLKAQLQERDDQLLNKKQGKYWNVDQKQLEAMEYNFQRKLEKINGECQEMVMAKATLENEVDAIRIKLRKTEQELSEKTSEISGLKERVQSTEDESKSLKTQLKEKDMLLLKQNQGRNWKCEFEQLEKEHKDLQRKFDKIKDESRAMEMNKCTLENRNENLKSMLRKTEQKLSEQTSEISKLNKSNESMNKESESLKTQLQEKDMMLLKRNQGRNMIGEYEQFELRHKDLQREFDKIKYESQAMAKDKTKLENENEKLRSMLQKTEQEFSKQSGEMTRLKKHAESVVEESESLHAQLKEKERQQLQQSQGRNLNVEYKKLEMRHIDLQRKFGQIEDDAQVLVVDKTRIENENEKLRSMLQKTEQEFSQHKSEMTKPKEHVESVVAKSESLKSQLQEKERDQLKQNQGLNLNIEYEQLVMSHNDLQRKFDKVEDEARALVVDKAWLENENEKLRSMLQKTEQEFSQHKSEMTKLKEHVESVVAKSESLKSQLQEKERDQLKQNQGLNLNVEYEQLVMSHNDLQRKFDKVEDEAQALMVDKTAIENENKKLSSVLRKTEQESLEQKKEIFNLRKRFENMDIELESFKAHLQQTERQLQEQILATTKANAEKDAALTSRQMGQQMSEWTPNIPDLSDPKRPSKLGERYSELYDNEWTNAFEVLTDKFGKDDKEAIDILRTILLESYKRALDFSISQMKEAEYKLSGSTKGVGPECKRLLKEARKHVDIKEADSLFENVLEVTLSKVDDRRQIRETTLQVFNKECFLLCWFMSIQDPPVVLVEDPTKGSRFDTNLYKHYIDSGDTVDYVVWPALILHKGGPLLTKGVAQPLVRPRSD